VRFLARVGGGPARAWRQKGELTGHVPLRFSVVASYTAKFRVVYNKHWAGNIAVGAVGMSSAQVVPIRPRDRRAVLQPHAVPGGDVNVTENCR
jgi:hypothetical protein